MAFQLFDQESQSDFPFRDFLKIAQIFNMEQHPAKCKQRIAQLLHAKQIVQGELIRKEVLLDLVETYPDYF